MLKHINRCDQYEQQCGQEHHPELPARKKVADEFSSVDYFADVMCEVFRAQKVLDENKEPIETRGRSPPPRAMLATGARSHKASFATNTCPNVKQMELRRRERNNLLTLIWQMKKLKNHPLQMIGRRQ
ncbi:hypothetical protein [Paludibacterium denitrificans]|uniref:hypothetical protein n=1 Tax=Paludibacterium denitrificans TaxID=2675226 RepID=UPI001E2A1899|nr:hypothetical protein [Paludibacterium denitrificans]